MLLTLCHDSVQLRVCSLGPNAMVYLLAEKEQQLFCFRTFLTWYGRLIWKPILRLSIFKQITYPVMGIMKY